MSQRILIGGEKESLQLVLNPESRRVVNNMVAKLIGNNLYDLPIRVILGIE